MLLLYDTRKIRSSTHDADHRRGYRPTEFPPYERIIANHVPKRIVESIDSKGPADGDALEEDEEEQAESGHRVRIENLKDVHASLWDAGQTDQVGESTNDRDE